MEEFKRKHKRIICKSGFSFSVQGADYNYCSPRDNEGPYSSLEVGFPSERVESLMEFAEDASKPTETVYGYVPVKVIEQIIADNGGIDIGKSI